MQFPSLSQSWCIGALLICITATADAALISRLGGQAVYEDDLNIMWLTDANLAASNTFGVAGINVDGSMSWSTANDWIAAMNAFGGSGYLGFNDWRLPVTAQPDSTCTSQTSVSSSGTSCTGSEMGHLYLVEGVTTSTPGLFSNLQTIRYWSGTEASFDPGLSWVFEFDVSGTQGIALQSIPLHGLVVRYGDVSVVPVPAAVWLFGSGLIGLVSIARQASRQ